MPTPQELFPKTEITIRGAKLRFSNFEKLYAFWDKERSEYRNILEGTKANHAHPAAQYLSDVKQRSNAVDSSFDQARSWFQRFPEAMTDEQKEELKAQLKRISDSIAASIQQVYADDGHGLWLSTEPTAQFLFKLAGTDRHAAAYALLYIRGVDFPADSYPAKNGMMEAHMFESNLSESRDDAELAAIGVITANWKKISDELAQQATAQNTTAAELNQLHAQEHAAQLESSAARKAEFDNFLKVRLEVHQKQVDASAQELTKIAEAYDQHMKLQAPVEYWKNKKIRHLTERSQLQRWTIIVGLSSFSILGLYVWNNFHEGAAGIVPWREIIGFFVLSSLTFWVVKILVRLLLSSIHLAEDAAEREVMAMTYMALVRGDGSKAKYLDEGDRALVLAPLFRPSSTGVIDDGAPPHVSEIITKVGR